MNLSGYSLAFDYKKTKLWTKLYDSDLFGVEIPGGQIIYLCIMGMNHNYNAVSVYPSQDSFQSYYRIVNNTAGMDTVTQHEAMYSQDCLQCAFNERQDLSEEEIKEVRNAAKQLGYKLQGRNNFPRFLHFEPFYLSIPVVDAEEERILDEALTACIDLSDMLKDKKACEIGIHHFAVSSSLILLKKKEEHYVIDGTVPVPSVIHMTYPAGSAETKEKAKKVMSAHRTGQLDCRLVPVPAPVSKEGPVFYPAVLMTIDSLTRKMIPIDLQKYDDSEALIHSFTDMLIKNNLYPTTINVCDDRTERLLITVCAQLQIHINRVNQLESIDFAYRALLQFMRMPA